MRTILTILPLVLVPLSTGAQAGTPDVLGQVTFSEVVGLPMSRAQIMKAAQEAWEYTFGQQPAARLGAIDPENGVLEGAARMNYRSSFLGAREESMGVIQYRVSIMANNGQCTVRVFDIRHTGDHAAPGGGIDAGAILDGDAPHEHYPGISLKLSQRLHADIRRSISERAGELMRQFAARLRLLAGQ